LPKLIAGVTFSQILKNTSVAILLSCVSKNKVPLKKYAAVLVMDLTTSKTFASLIIWFPLAFRRDGQ
jgi:hypothetical protein